MVSRRCTSLRQHYATADIAGRHKCRPLYVRVSPLILATSSGGRWVSGRGESHPPALAEPDLNLSAHPAPITQPPVSRLPANVQRVLVHVFRRGSGTSMPDVGVASTACISFGPIAPNRR